MADLKLEGFRKYSHLGCWNNFLLGGNPSYRSRNCVLSQHITRTAIWDATEGWAVPFPQVSRRPFFFFFLHKSLTPGAAIAGVGLTSPRNGESGSGMCANPSYGGGCCCFCRESSAGCLAAAERLQFEGTGAVVRGYLSAPRSVRAGSVLAPRVVGRRRRASLSQRDGGARNTAAAAR